jgi:Mg2+-importing ATPase
VNVILKGETQIVPQFLFAVALAVSVIPEALPAIVSVTLARGALALAKRHVVVKRLSAIEDLGHIEVLCSDKTGTITEGIMSVDGVSAIDAKQCLEWALATGDEEELKQPAHTPKTFIAAIIAKTGMSAAATALEWRRHWFVPFDPSRRRATAVFDDGQGPLLAILGAPEETISRSTQRMSAQGLKPMTAEDAQAERQAFKGEGLAGRRVLALAIKRVSEKAVYGDDDEQGLTYVGRISFVDPIKPTAKQAVADARKLHVIFKIITGDSPEVAGAVALETGIIEHHEEVVSGEQLDAAPDAEFHRLVVERHVFARVTPEQKFRIIQALERGFDVGFLGEGINDAPALKAANVALAVDGASDVAREAADIILLKRDLHVIIDGIREGRGIFTNIIKYVKYTLIGNFGNFLAIAGVSLLIDELPMLPVQILLTNLLTDLPLISVAGDSVDEAEVAAPKRFNLRELAFVGLFLGLVSSFFDFSFFALNRGEGMPAMRTLWFQFSVITELVLIYSIRTRGPFWKAVRPGKAMLVLTALTTLIALWIVMSPIGTEIFRFVRPDARQLGKMLTLCLAYFVATEAVKLSYYKVFKPSPDAV